MPMVSVFTSSTARTPHSLQVRFTPKIQQFRSITSAVTSVVVSAFKVRDSTLRGSSHSLLVGAGGGRSSGEICRWIRWERGRRRLAEAVRGWDRTWGSVSIARTIVFAIAPRTSAVLSSGHAPSASMMAGGCVPVSLVRGGRAPVQRARDTPTSRSATPPHRMIPIWIVTIAVLLNGWRVAATTPFSQRGRGPIPHPWGEGGGASAATTERWQAPKGIAVDSEIGCRWSTAPGRIETRPGWIRGRGHRPGVVGWASQGRGGHTSSPLEVSMKISPKWFSMLLSWMMASLHVSHDAYSAPVRRGRRGHALGGRGRPQPCVWRQRGCGRSPAPRSGHALLVELEVLWPFRETFHLARWNRKLITDNHVETKE